MPFRVSSKCLFALFSAAVFLTLSTGCFLNDGTDYAYNIKKYDAATLGEINAIIDSQMAAGSIPGAVIGIWQEGYETQFIAKGLADVAAVRAARVTDRFRIASNTKMFTGMALLILAGEKNISLDDKLSKYLTDVPHSDRVTIRQLATHSSGYPDYTFDKAFIAACAANPLRSWKPREMLEYIRNAPLEFEPGAGCHYSNTGYLLMGMLIEQLSGVSWEDYVTRRLIDPLGLSETLCPKDSSIPGSHLKGYNIENSLPVEIVVDPSFGWSAGAMISTVSDMKKWLDALASGSLLSPKMFAEQRKVWVTDPNSTGLQYGFGLMLVRSRFVGHTGVIPGYNSAAFISLDGKKAVIAVFNDEDGFLGADTAFKIMKYLFL